MILRVAGIVRIDFWRTPVHLVRMNELVQTVSSLAGLAHDDFPLKPEHYGSQYDDTPFVKEVLRELRQDCVALDLNMTVMLIDAVLESVEPDLEHSYRMNLLLSVLDRLRDEVSARTYFYMPQGSYDLYERQQPFGDLVWDTFPNANHDVQEAAKCLALGRCTACVMHLMRIIELGMRALIEDSFGDTLPNRPKWDVLVSAINRKAGVADKGNAGVWNGRGNDLRQIAAHLHTIKINTRNAVMHPAEKYDQDEATRTYDATRLLMQGLAAALRRAADHDQEGEDPINSEAASAGTA